MQFLKPVCMQVSTLQNLKQNLEKSNFPSKQMKLYASIKEYYLYIPYL